MNAETAWSNHSAGPEAAILNWYGDVLMSACESTKAL